MIWREKHNTSYDLASSFRVQTRGALGRTAGHGVRMSPNFPCWSLWPWRCRGHFGIAKSKRKKKWMGGCLHRIIEKHKCQIFCLPS